MRASKKIKVGALIFLLALFLLPTFAYAVPWWPLVPCGLNKPSADAIANGATLLPDSYYQSCSQCDLFKLAKNVIDILLIGIMPPVATLIFVIAGFMILMGGANPGLVSKGREYMKYAAIGVALMSGAWLITNTIIKSLANPDVEGLNTPWYAFQCSGGGTGGTGGNYSYSESTYGGYSYSESGYVPIKYGCNSSNKCDVSASGAYTTNNCDSKCQAPVGGVLAIISESLPDGTVRQPYSFQVRASGGTPPYRFSTRFMPAGLSLSSTGLISGTPTTADTLPVQIDVEDSASPKQSTFKSFNFRIKPIQVDPIITTTSLSDARINTDYVQSLGVTGGRGPYFWSITGSAQLPSGLMINSSVGEISGKPTVSGDFTFTVTVLDSSTPIKTANKQLRIKVVDAAASLVISGISLTNISATGVTFTWRTDKPATSQVQYLIVGDQLNRTTSVDQTLKTSHSMNLTGLSPNTDYIVNAVSTIPGFVARSSDLPFKTLLQATQFSFPLSTLPDAIVGTSYSQTIILEGGQAPYLWSVSNGALPVGLIAVPIPSGIEIRGTPTTPGTSTPTVQVTDSSTPPKKTPPKPVTVRVVPNATGGLCSGKSCTFSGRPDTVSCTAVDPGDGCNQAAIGLLSADIVSGVGSRSICSDVDTVKLLKSIISNESRGRVDIPSSDGLSQGPFQLTVATATQYKRNCNVPTSDVINFDWLARRDTVSYQACIATEFIKTLVSPCGCDARQLAAGYNGGGGGACAASSNCGASAGTGQCSICADQNRSTRRWECLYDDNAHQVCNSDRTAGTLAFTRRYAPKVEYCYSRF